jgi:hypothetical protein
MLLEWCSDERGSPRESMEEKGITMRPFLVMMRHGEYWKSGTAVVLSLGERRQAMVVPK